MFLIPSPYLKYLNRIRFKTHETALFGKMIWGHYIRILNQHSLNFSTRIYCYNHYLQMLIKPGRGSFLKTMNQGPFESIRRADHFGIWIFKMHIRNQLIKTNWFIYLMSLKVKKVKSRIFSFSCFLIYLVFIDFRPKVSIQIRNQIRDLLIKTNRFIYLMSLKVKKVKSRIFRFSCYLIYLVFIDFRRKVSIQIRNQL